MDYNKFKLGAYNLHVIKTNRFKTISIEVYFRREIKKEETTIRHFLSKILIQSTKNYPTLKQLVIEKQNLYNASIISNVGGIGNSSFLCFKLNVLNDTYTEEGNFKKAAKLFFDVIFNPNVDNNKFDFKSFSNTKEQVEADIKAEKENIVKYAIRRMLNNMNEKLPLSFRLDGYLEDLDKITEENLLNYYQQVINSDLVDIFVLGDVDINEIKKLIVEYVKINTIKKPMKNIILNPLKYRRRAKKVMEEEKDIDQAHLVLGFDLYDITDFERKYVLPIYNSIIGGNADSRLFNIVREKHSLAYTTFSGIKSLSSFFFIYSGINKENYEKALRLIRKQLKEIEKGNFDDKEIEKGQKEYINSTKNMEDSDEDIISTYLLKEIAGTDLLEEKVKKIKKVTKNDVIKISKKVKLNTIFLLHGGNKNEKD
jgi:predicted Zn-dependent peptidase